MVRFFPAKSLLRCRLCGKPTIFYAKRHSREKCGRSKRFVICRINDNRSFRRTSGAAAESSQENSHQVRTAGFTKDELLESGAFTDELAGVLVAGVSQLEYSGSEREQNYKCALQSRDHKPNETGMVTLEDVRR